ncbi:hypothetical protein [Paraburkholderia sp. BCC1885]|uniref:hypothetical protein n=1 Tax=Paraburkholderia sp. BCC1885 TaxID=2562669 RepID=UPI0011827A0E|nr:hypothetical protein [Paraburkholderia sp. BCC1885]
MKHIEIHHPVQKTLTEFIRDPVAMGKECEGHPVVLLRRNEPLMCLLSMEHWGSLVRELDGYRQELVIRQTEGREVNEERGCDCIG